MTLLKKLLKIFISANSLTASHRNFGPDHLQLDRYDCICEVRTKYSINNFSWNLIFNSLDIHNL